MEPRGPWWGAGCEEECEVVVSVFCHPHLGVQAAAPTALPCAECAPSWDGAVTV